MPPSPKIAKHRSRQRLFFLGGLIVLGFFAFVTVLGDEGLLKLRSLYQLRDRVKQENRDIFNTNRKLIREIALLKDPLNTQRLIREKLGYLKSHEYVLILNENSSSPSSQPSWPSPLNH